MIYSITSVDQWFSCMYMNQVTYFVFERPSVYSNIYIYIYINKSNVNA